MLKKTFELISQFKSGTYVGDDVDCYDESEITELGNALRRLVYSPSKLRRRLQDIGVILSPANFYSEIPLIRDIEQFETGPQPSYDRCFDAAVMDAVLDSLVPLAKDFDPPQESRPEQGFSWKGGPFSYSDAMAYYCFVRRAKPATIVEVGSGWSTLVADAAVRANGSGKIVCVEPYPADFLSSIPSVAEVVQKPAQDLGPDFFNAHLCDNDILFIDSTHTVKHRSDCVHLYLTILPALRSHLTIHAHDIYLPRPMPINYMRDRQIYWTEQYLLYAYLLGNARTNVLFGSSYHSIYSKAKLNALMHGRYSEGGASLWFSQAGLKV